MTLNTANQSFTGCFGLWQSTIRLSSVSKESLVQKISSKSYFDHTSPHCDLDDTLIAIHLFGLTLQLMMMHHCTKFDYQRLSGPKIYIFRQNLDSQTLLFQYPPPPPKKTHTKNTLLPGDIMNQTDIIQGEKEQLRDKKNCHLQLVQQAQCVPVTEIKPINQVTRVNKNKAALCQRNLS